MCQKEKVINIFGLFSRQFEKLGYSGFLDKLGTEKSGVSFKWERGRGFTKIERKGPSDDEVKSFVVNIRLFMQDNESISFRNISKLCDLDFLSDDWKTKFKEARRILNEYLDSKSLYIHNNEEITNRELFDLFAYGDITHLTLSEKYDRVIKGFPISYDMMMNDLVVILANIFNAVSNVDAANKEELDKLNIEK